MTTWTERVHAIGGWVLGLVALGLLAFGFGSCVERDWRFENACRAAGGYVASASTISGAGIGTGKEVCAKVVQPPVSTPIPLPGYRP